MRISLLPSTILLLSLLVFVGGDCEDSKQAEKGPEKETFYLITFSSGDQLEIEDFAIWEAGLIRTQRKKDGVTLWIPLSNIKFIEEVTRDKNPKKP